MTTNMNFHLPFLIPAFSEQLNYNQQSIFVGSCFSENIGEMMQLYKFNCMNNPHGILYNPYSISKSIHRYLDLDLIKEDELFFANEQWNSWEHHSCFSHSDKAVCLNQINNSITEAHRYLKNADWLFITWGSAFVYKHIETAILVGNCHKVPQKQFEKKLLSATEIVEDYQPLLSKLQHTYPQLKVVFTVSPVRYIRDGIVENNISKAQLLSAVHALKKEFDNVYYFPAYEIVIDELRDYRFYKTDLVHPNEQAVEYVFEKFKNILFDSNTISNYEKVKEIVKAKKHLPFNKSSLEFRKFKQTFLEKCNQLQKQIPSINLEEEVLYFKS